MKSSDRKEATDKDIFLAWERADSPGKRVKALLPLCASILFRPALFFKAVALLGRLDLKKRLWRAFVFALILGYLKLLLDVVNIYWVEYLAKNFLEGSKQLQISLLSATIIQSPFFILRPLINFMLVFLVLSISIKLVLGFDKKLSPLFLIICYKSASEIFYLLPIVGGLIALAWSLFIFIVGLRECYRADILRLIMAGFIMPVLIAIFIVLAAGPSFNNFILSIYPETRSQVTKINETSAFISTQDISKAIAQYKQELGFYPAHLGVLDKYLGSGVAQELDSSLGSGGYNYLYHKMDEHHFTLFVKPMEKDTTGRFTFYTDETGKIYLDDAGGKVIDSAQEVQQLILNNKG
ncbi:MAG: hypothetical protein ABIC68_03335 [Candidatus Omnitrophota bacterium]